MELSYPPNLAYHATYSAEGVTLVQIVNRKLWQQHGVDNTNWKLGTEGWARLEIPRVAEDYEGRIEQKEGHDDKLQKQQSFSWGP